MFAVDAELISEFLAESNERLTLIEELLLAYESADATKGREVIQQLYREFHTLKGNAAFLGYVNISDLSHAVESVLKAISEGEIETDDSVMPALFNAHDKIKELLEDPDSAIGDSTAELVAEFNRIAGIAPPPAPAPESELPSPLAVAIEQTPEERAAEPPPNEPTEESIADPRVDTEPDDSIAEPAFERKRLEQLHTDTDVYRISIIQSVRKASNDPDAWMVSQLASLAQTLSHTHPTAGFSRALLDIFRGHQVFWQIDRICLTGVAPNSTQLVVVDSINGKRAHENLMAPGYTCFVNPRGSLFQMQPGMVRIFDESVRVIKSFQREQRPVQRSIANVAAMGLHSGACLAVGDRGNLQGFLFLNSQKSGLFRDMDRDYASLLSVLSIFAKAALHSVGFFATDESKTTPRSIVAPFRDNVFLHALQREYSQDFGGAPEFRIENHCQEPFLYMPLRQAALVAAAVEAAQLPLRRPGQPIVLHFGPHRDRISCRFAHGVAEDDLQGQETLQRRLAGLHHSPKAVGYKVTGTTREISISFSYEPVVELCGDDYYSVVSPD